MRAISKRHKGVQKRRLEAIMFPPGSARPHPGENSCSWPHYGWRGTEIKEWSSGPIVLPEIRFRFHSYIQIILRSTAIHRVAIYHSHRLHTHCQHEPTICQYLPTYLHRASRWWPWRSCCVGQQQHFPTSDDVFSSEISNLHPIHSPLNVPQRVDWRVWFVRS